MPWSFDRIKSGTILSSSFSKQESFSISNFKSIHLKFARFSTSNQALKADYNCGSSLNIYYRLDGGAWTHKMAYCGQHLKETNGWRQSELEFETKGHNTIDFLFSYESHLPKTSTTLYLIDDLEVVGTN